MEIVISKRTAEDISRLIEDSQDLVDTRGFISVKSLNERYNSQHEKLQQIYIANFGKILKSLGYQLKKTISGSHLIYPETE